MTMLLQGKETPFETELFSAIMNKLVEFHEEYSKIDITVVNRPSSELLKLLENNEIDFVIDTMSFKDELDYFNVKEPKPLYDVRLQLKDINYHKNMFINGNSTIKSIPAF